MYLLAFFVLTALVSSSHVPSQVPSQVTFIKNNKIQKEYTNETLVQRDGCTYQLDINIAITNELYEHMSLTRSLVNQANGLFKPSKISIFPKRILISRGGNVWDNPGCKKDTYTQYQNFKMFPKPSKGVWYLLDRCHILSYPTGLADLGIYDNSIGIVSIRPLNDYIFVHELGHTMGLIHVKETGMMNSNGHNRGDDFTPQSREKLKKTIVRFREHFKLPQENCTPALAPVPVPSPSPVSVSVLYNNKPPQTKVSSRKVCIYNLSKKKYVVRVSQVPLRVILDPQTNVITTNNTTTFTCKRSVSKRVPKNIQKLTKKDLKRRLCLEFRNTGTVIYHNFKIYYHLIK